MNPDLMSKTRLEAFSDGVIAIIITIMVLELKKPEGADFAALLDLKWVLLGYVLSFIFVGIYWSNHHHMIQAVKHVDGRVLWANLHLLFWLSLVPFVTAWMGEHGSQPGPVAAYGVVLLGSALAYSILVLALSALHDHESAFRRALGSGFKEKVSLAIYAAAIPLAFVRTWLAQALFVVVAIIWLVPDRRFERALMK